ncbi:winged helix DNA-binding domain-containing protein [Raineyella sp.]|uniref:winged helix DNA-binding domain-containing protein n=1 Tax=Raineyella sp. TaxID=1911550 RepID=UPI002B21C52B|nr:winged helix DNA-binding domain-containing protein [Raineyella sp.]MEA5153271.1 winged helix DNA-binding domain-containing protein [Raineyella sp.]
MVEKVSKGDVIAFRLRAHHLLERSDADGLLDVTGRCGIQNSPPGSALLALHARVRDITRQRVDEAVADDRSLVQTWCMRGAPFYVPTADAPVFTTGVLPPTEATMRHFLLGAGPAVDRLGMSLTEAVALTEAEIGDVLSGRGLAIDELGTELAGRIARRLPLEQRDIWEEEGPYAPGQPLGEAVVHFCVRILTLRRVVCFAPRTRNRAPFVLATEWLGQPIPDTDPETARTELLRRYLHCYGPSTRADFAAWLGIRAGDTDPWWRLLADGLTQVEFGGTAWILTEDLDALRSGATPQGVRLLPPHDPYVQARDREMIVEKKHHRDVWRTIGDPGTILADGAIIGTWRPRRTGRTLTITVRTFGALSSRHRTALQDEAEQIAPLRDASAAVVEFDTY